MKEFDLLKQLKDGLLEVNPYIKDTNQFFGDITQGNGEKAKKYYLTSMKDNFYKSQEPIFKIRSDANAVRSSATMIYNTLYSGNLKTKEGTEYIGYKNLYEIPFDAIVDEKKSTHTAQLDAGLISKDGESLLLFEAKCLEWIDKKPKGLKKSYLSSDCYLFEKSASIFIPLFKNLIFYNETDLEFSPRTIRYDSIQMMIHMLSIYNWCLQNKDKPKKIKLINLVWDYDCEEYFEEEKEGNVFIEFANESLQEEFRQIGVDFAVEYIRYSKFLNLIDWTNDIDHRIYLRRYETKTILSDIEFKESFNNLWKETKPRGKSQEEYERDLKDLNIKLEDDAFDKIKSAKRYNPKKEDEAYKRDSLVNMDNEEWRFLMNQYYTKYAVSNLGRVAFLDKDKFYHILEQDDDYSKYYLRLDPKRIYKVDHQIEVYKLIAMGFLGKQIGDGYDVHHKINDGYNCRPANLMLLTREQHNAVHMSELQYEKYKDHLLDYLENKESDK